MKKAVALFMCILLIFSFGACSNKENEDEEKEKITVCLDWTPNTNHTGLYVAAAKGYYEEAGLDVEIVQPPENEAVLMCAMGQAQFAVDAQDTLAASLAQENPLGVTAVAAIMQHNTSGIISRKGENIDTPKGLEGKRYSTWNSPIEKAIIKEVVENDGGDFEKVTLIPNVFNDEAGALKNKDTDAIWIFYGWGGINAKLNGLDFDYFNFVDIDSKFDYYTPVLISNNDYLETSPEKAKAFLEATKKGYTYASENPEEAAKILVESDTTGSLKGSEDFVIESQKWISKQYIADAKEWGTIEAERWDGFYKWLFENGLIEKELPAGTGFSNEYLG